MGLFLTALCLIGASASFSKPVKAEEGEIIISQQHDDTIPAVWMEMICSKIPGSFRSLLKSVFHLYSSWIEDGINKHERRKAILDNDRVDMKIMSHVGSCQCESVMFTVRSFFRISSVW